MFYLQSLRSEFSIFPLASLCWPFLLYFISLMLVRFNTNLTCGVVWRGTTVVQRLFNVGSFRPFLFAFHSLEVWTMFGNSFSKVKKRAKKLECEVVR